MNKLEQVENGWRRIETDEDWRKVDLLIKGGNDGVIKDLHWSHQDYVDQELNMIFEGNPRVWLLVQLQNESASSVEFLLEEVEDVCLNLKHEIVLSAEFDSSSIVLAFSGHRHSFIRAKELAYRIPNPASIGKRTFDYFK